LNAIFGGLVFAIGVALLAAPSLSSTLPPDDAPLLWGLGTIFAGFGAYVALPERCARLRTLVLVLALGTFGAFCAALVFTPFAPDPEGTYTIGGIHGFRTSTPMPWWARLVAAFFALVFLAASALGLWGLVRDFVTGRRETPPSP
jgi:hypothetical protein